MAASQTKAPSYPRTRYERVDLARGVALIGVMIFHLCWDLRYFEFVLWPMDSHWGWVAFQKSLVTAFVGLSGFSLWLAHDREIRWRAFWKRWALLAGAALAITVATWFTFQPAFVYFGVLHALALFAILGLPFLRLPRVILLPLAGAIIVLGIALHDPAFNEKPLSWLGFWTIPPYTNDLVPVFPWFGVYLIGIALGRSLNTQAGKRLLVGPSDWGGVGRMLRFVGRHSLIVYLVHQPLLLAVLVPLESVVQPQTWYRAERFVVECEASCTMSSPDPAFCTRYCSCALEQIQEADMWAAVESLAPTETEQSDINAMIGLCTAMGRATDQ